MKAVAAALATAAVMAGAAWASNITPQQFAKLNARVVKLEKANAQLETFVKQCLHSSLAVSQYGDDPAGYEFRNVDGTTQVTTALDVTDAGTSSQYRLAAFPDACKDVTPVAATP